LFAERAAFQDDIKELLLREILSADDKTIPEKFYPPGRIQSTSPAGYMLYSVDDIDRAIGAVRLDPSAPNRLL
jgi:hypothetical protein